MPQVALESAKALLAYWQAELNKAREAHDAKRILAAEDFVGQCERIISSLEHAIKGRR